MPRQEPAIQVTVRVPVPLHCELSEEADRLGLSMSQTVLALLTKAILDEAKARKPRAS